MRVPALICIGLSIAAAGCASSQQQQAPTSGAAPAGAPVAIKAPQPDPRYRTGSRVPLPPDEEGAQSVSAASREEHEEAMRRTMGGARGN